MRKFPFVNKEFYHVYNRGTEKRNIFEDKYDVQRFFQSMDEFNVTEPIGSIYAASFKKDTQLRRPTSKLSKSSWNEYSGESKEEFCKKDIILGQFNDKNEYQDFAMDSFEWIIENKEKNKETESIFLE